MRAAKPGGHRPLRDDVGWPAFAQVDPDPLIAPVVFSLVAGQPPRGRRSKAERLATASQAFWQRQISLIESAGFRPAVPGVLRRRTVQRESPRRHADCGGSASLAARSAAHRAFFAAETFADYLAPKTCFLLQASSASTRPFAQFFTMYAAYFPRGRTEGNVGSECWRRSTGECSWSCGGCRWRATTCRRASLQTLSDRLQRDFGFRAYWSVHDGGSAAVRTM